MFIKIYLFAYSVDKTIMPMCRAPAGGAAGGTWSWSPRHPLRQSPQFPEVG